jgi:Pentapeptide repeats (8 copies)
MAGKADGKGGPEAPGRIDLRMANLRGVNFAGKDFRYADLRAADLREVNFTGSDLSYADLRGAHVQYAMFQNASLYGAKLQGMEAEGADFRNADTRLANWGGVYLDGAITPWAGRVPSPEEMGDVRRENTAQAQAATADTKPERAESPGAIAYDAKEQVEDWQQEIARKSNEKQGGNQDDNRDEKAKGRSEPEGQRDKSGGRGR